MRTLTGNRKHPDETIQVTAPQALSASFTPDYFDRKEISWTVGDAALISVDGEDKSASVQAKKDAKWIRDLIAADQGRHVNTPYEIQTASGSRTTKVTVIGDDMLGNRQTASCRVQVDFRTVDESKICVEGISLIPKTLQYEIKRTRTGAGYRSVEAWTGTGAKKLAASVFPAQAFNQKVTYQASDDSLYVSSDGTVTVNTTASWIQELDRQYLKSGSHTAYVTVKTEDGGFTDRAAVTIQYEAVDQTYSGGSHSGSGSGGGSSSGKGAAAGSSAANATGPASGFSDLTGAGIGNLTEGQAGPGQNADAAAIPEYVVAGNWRKNADGTWQFEAGGRSYASEWAAVYNPYADPAKGQSTFDWFRFDADGRMVNGWYTDVDGNTYYLWTEMGIL